MTLRLLSGNEAVALGAYQAGVRVGAAYPGTPSTQILEHLSTYEGIYCEWAANEKVALDVAVGAAYVGRRALAAMKHVGLNVAADSFFYASMTGTKAGLVVVSADDPNMYSSQNEQDNRHYARFAKVPALEPADSAEACEFTRLAFDISERFDTPVMLRTVTRIAHSKTIVDVPEFSAAVNVDGAPAVFDRNPAKYVMIPGFARARRPVVERRLEALSAYADECPANRTELGDRRIGIIASGTAYQYAREVFPAASFLKLGMVYPLPKELIRSFAREVERVVVIEELDPFIEEQVRLLGVDVAVDGKRFFPVTGELTPEIVRAGAEQAGLLPPSAKAAEPKEVGSAALPARPPILCVGCGHRAVFYVLKQLKLTVYGDIGCYTLGAMPPLSALDTCGCMGAGIGQAHGAAVAGAKAKSVAIIGDSTFFHSGISALVNTVYNRSADVVIVTDNGTTAMTGHQDHPGTGQTLGGVGVPTVRIEDVVRGLGISDVTVLDAYDLAGLRKALKRALSSDQPAVIVARHPCVLQVRQQDAPLRVDEERCNLCGLCLPLGCQAISKDTTTVSIDPEVCIGCPVCDQTCARKAIVP